MDALSGGMRAQVALALALGKRPEVLLLDEPVAALDPLARREFLGSLAAAVAEGGLTVLLSSHLLPDLERVCDHLILIEDARPMICAEIDDLLASHKLLSAPTRDTTARRARSPCLDADAHATRGQPHRRTQRSARRPRVAQSTTSTSKTSCSRTSANTVLARSTSWRTSDELAAVAPAPQPGSGHRDRAGRVRRRRAPHRRAHGAPLRRRDPQLHGQRHVAISSATSSAATARSSISST